MYGFIFDSWDIFQAGYHKTGCKHPPLGVTRANPNGVRSGQEALSTAKPDYSGICLFFSTTELSNSLTKLNPLKNSHFVLAVAVPRGRRVTTSWGPLIISGIKLSKTSTSRWPHAIAELPWATYWNFPLLLPCVSLTLPWSKHWGWQKDWDWGEEYEVVSDSLQQWKIIIWAILLNQVYETNPLFFLPLRAVLIKNFIKRKSSHKWAHMTRANHKQFTALIVI